MTVELLIVRKWLKMLYLRELLLTALVGPIVFTYKLLRFCKGGATKFCARRIAHRTQVVKH